MSLHLGTENWLGLAIVIFLKVRRVCWDGLQAPATTLFEHQTGHLSANCRWLQAPATKVLKPKNDPQPVPSARPRGIGAQNSLLDCFAGSAVAPLCQACPPLKAPGVRRSKSVTGAFRLLRNQPLTLKLVGSNLGPFAAAPGVRRSKRSTGDIIE